MSRTSTPSLLRALSPWPGRALLAGLGCLFVSERALAGAAAALPLRLVAAGLVFATLASRLVDLVRRPAATRDYARLQLGATLSVVLGGGLYATSVAANEDGASLLPPYALVGALLGLALGGALTVAVDLAAAPMRPSGAIARERLLAAAATAVSLVFALGALVFLNVAASRFEARLDFAQGGTASPSATTLSLLDGSPRPVELLLFFERGSPVVPELRDYVDRLEARGAVVRFLDQALEPELAKELKVSRNGTVVFRSGERSESYYVGTEREAAQRKLKKLDEEVRTRVARLTRDERTVYFTSGHGERGEATAKAGERPAASLFAKLARALNAQVKPLGLKEGLGRAVPDDAAIVVVHGPTTRFLEAERDALLSFLEGGGAVLLLVDPGSDHGLEPVLARAGLAVSRAELRNDQEFVRRTQTDADHAFLFSSSFTSHKATRALADTRGKAALLFFGAGHLVRVEAEGAKVTTLARSRGGTFLDENANRRFDTGEKREVYDLVAAVDITRAHGEPGRALVVADSDVLSDTLTVAEANAAFGYEALLWLLRDDVVQGVVTGETDVPLMHTRDTDVLWFYATTAAVPALVLTAGLTVVRRRRQRRRQS